MLIELILGIIVVVVFSQRLFVFIRRKRNTKLLETVTNSTRGTRSERDLVLRLLKSGRTNNAVFHDLYIPRAKDQWSQIDLVLATSVGIVVFEVKDYSGWIYGNSSHNQWTQVLSYGKLKYRFFNPIKQNATHVRELKNWLRLPDSIPFISVIVFYGDCELKDIEYIPKDTFVSKYHRISELLRHIEQTYPEAPFEDKWSVVSRLEEAVRLGDDLTVRDNHINQVKDLVGKHRIYD